MTQERITMIKEGLAILKPLEREIEDEGHLHVGHAGAKSGGHFKLYIVSESFNSKPSKLEKEDDDINFLNSDN